MFETLDAKITETLWNSGKERKVKRNLQYGMIKPLTGSKLCRIELFCQSFELGKKRAGVDRR